MGSFGIRTPVWSPLAGTDFRTKASPAGYPGMLLWSLKARVSKVHDPPAEGWTREAPLPLATGLLAGISASPWLG